MPLSDNEIIEKIRAGKKRHYSILVDRYKEKAMTLAVRMLRRREDAEEAAQDAFIRAYNALNGFQGTARFGTWFYRILYNVCLTRLGRGKKESLFIDYDDGKEYDVLLPADTGGLPDFELNDTIEFVRKTVEELPLKYGVILSLFYFQELSYEEICDITKLPLGTVKTHLFRARTLLQNRLQNEFQMENAI